MFYPLSINKMIMEWKKHLHPLYKRLEELESMNQSMVKNLFRQPKFSFSKWQWISEQGHSIVSPSTVTFEQYELYDGIGVYRFDTLKEAKEYAKGLQYRN